MTRRPFIPVVLILGILFLLAGMYRPYEGTSAAESVTNSVILPVQVDLNLGGNPETLDPALASSSASLNVIEQLFIGLVDLDEETGDVNPELATSWSVSPDGLVYTFTLRDDVLWTDGRRVVAGDVRYGILRSLDPAVDSPNASLLFIIENAQAYHEGRVGPEQVGVIAQDATHLQIRLEEPAAYLPTILTSWVARPVPHTAIENWGADWTKPAHIITNGAYLLSEWVSGDHILLEKSTSYYDAAAVQIERVNMQMIADGDEAWQLYLDGGLDSAYLPAGVMLDPTTKEEIRQQPYSCTYYYGYVNNKPPLDDVRVRKALAMATNKAFAKSIGATPATQFAPPGVWGAPPYGSVGLPYNPEVARPLLRSYLIDKRINLKQFNDMAITLLINEGEAHRSIAEGVRRDWIYNLGVYIQIKEVPWEELLSASEKDTPLADAPHIFRFGWCSDYPDEHNWLYENFNNQGGFNRLRRGCADDTCTTTYPQEFDRLTEQAQRELEPNRRRNLYFRAEQALAEEEVAYLPLYFNGAPLATKPHLARTYASYGGYDIATWGSSRVQALIGPGGGSLTSFDGKTTLVFPAGAYTNTAIVTYAPDSAMPPADSLVRAGHAFSVSAVEEATGQSVELAPGKAFALVFKYDAQDRGPVVEETMALYYWDGNQWLLEPTGELDHAAKVLTAAPDYLATWALQGETNRAYLPQVRR